MLAALFLALLPARTPEFGTDPALDRPIAVEARIEPLPEFLARIGRTLGTPLTVERRMEGLKATVFTPARPARLTLAGLASVFDAEWTPQKEGGYQLAETAVARRRRESYLAREEEIRRAEAELRLTRPVEFPEFIPTGETDKDERRRQEVEVETRRLPFARRIVAAFARLSPAERERFWRGELLHQVVPVAAGPEERIPVDGDENAVQIIRHPGGANLTLIRYTPGGDGLRVALYDPGALGGGGGSRGGSVVEPRWGDLKLADHPFRRAQREWSTDLSAAIMPELDSPLKTLPYERTRWTRKSATASDVLWEVFRRSSVPIVAEANRQISGPLLQMRPTLRDELRDGYLSQGQLRLEAGTLLYRPEGFWQTRLTEPSEAALAPFERDAVPSLDSLATLYASLSPMCFTTGEPGLATFEGTPPFASVHELSAPFDRFHMDDDDSRVTLRLWGRLPLGLRARLAGGEIVPLASLSAGERTILGDSLLDAALGPVIAMEGLGGCWVFAPEDAEEEPDPARIVVGLLGFGPSRPYALSATVGKIPRQSEGKGEEAPARHSLEIRLTDDRGFGLRFPKVGPY